MKPPVRGHFIIAAMPVIFGIQMTGVGQEQKTAVKGYPKGISEIRYRSAADDSEQPALFWAPKPEKDKPAPLLVALHTWSGNYRQAGGESKYAEWCQKMGWVFIHPNFRGPNWTPEALGSDLVVVDIRSAVDFAKANANVDESRIYCVGVSGGGHASLLMAGRAPELWAGVSAWCGISDIAMWHEQCSDTKFANYAEHIEKALGDAPSLTSNHVGRAYNRSPIAWLRKAGGVPLDINHGITDGRTGSVPFTHSLKAWNAVVPGKFRMADDLIEAFYESQLPPATNESDSNSGGDLSDPHGLYGNRAPLFRRIHENTRVTIFDGGHEIVHDAALNWLAAQQKEKPANWNPPKVAELDSTGAASQSGK